MPVVRELLERGATVDAADGIGETPLIIASMRGHLPVVRELLERGATVDAADDMGDTPLYVAIWKGHLGIISELLARGAKVSKKILKFAINPVIKALLEEGPQQRPAQAAPENSEIKALLEEDTPRWAYPRNRSVAPAIGGRRRRYTHTKRTKRKASTRKNRSSYV